MISRLTFWLTTHVDCCVCKRRLHRAWFPGTIQIGAATLPSVSHGICPTCARVTYGIETRRRGVRVGWLLLIAAIVLAGMAALWPNFWISLASFGCAWMALILWD